MLNTDSYSGDKLYADNLYEGRTTNQGESTYEDLMAIPVNADSVIAGRLSPASTGREMAAWWWRRPAMAGHCCYMRPPIPRLCRA